MQLSGYRSSTHSDIRVLHFEVSRLLENESFKSPPGVVHRKKVSTLSKRYLEDILTDVITDADFKYSSDSANSSAVFKTLALIASKKQKKCDDIISTLEFEDESMDDGAHNSDDDENSHGDDIASVNDVDSDNEVDEEEIQNIIKKFPVKKIKYSRIEVSHVLSLFSSIKELFERRGKPKINTNIASMVKKKLQHLSGFCSLKSRNILQWYMTHSDVKKKRGVKVDKAFEAEVLGNILICVFEEIENV